MTTHAAPCVNQASGACVCLCVCVCARVCACVCVCVCACVCVFFTFKSTGSDTCCVTQLFTPSNKDPIIVEKDDNCGGFLLRFVWALVSGDTHVEIVLSAPGRVSRNARVRVGLDCAHPQSSVEIPAHKRGGLSARFNVTSHNFGDERSQRNEDTCVCSVLPSARPGCVMLQLCFCFIKRNNIGLCASRSSGGAASKSADCRRAAKQ